MSLDDVIKAFGALNQGLQEAAITNATNQATREVEQIRHAEIADEEKRKAYSQAAQDLALQLSAAGAPASRIQTAFSALAPQQAGTAQQAILSDDPTLRARGEEALGAQQARKESLISVQAAEQRKTLSMKPAVSGAEQRQLNQMILSQQDKFKKDNSDSFKALDAVKKLEGFLATNNPGAIEMGKTALLRLAGEVGRITDEDIKRAQLNPSLATKGARWIKAQILNKRLEVDAEEMSRLAKVLAEKTRETLTIRAGSFAKARAKRLGVDESEFLNDLKLEFTANTTEQQSSDVVAPQPNVMRFIRRAK
jgi:hypothetical protein